MGYFVMIGGTGTPQAWRDEHPDMYQKRLAIAYESATPVFCSCRAGEGTRLSIRSLGSEDRPHFVLARWPKSGLKHTADCDFFGVDPSDDGRLGPGVIVQRSNGTLGLRLDPSLSRPNVAAAPGPTGERHGAKSQPPIALRELLELLFEQADLARWDPRFLGKRNAYVVARALANAAEGISVGRNRRLNERLIVVLSRPSEQQIGAAQATWDDARAAGEGVVLVGTLKGVPDEPGLGHDTAPVYLQSAAGAYRIVINATEHQIGDVRTSFRRELAAFAGGGDDADRDFVTAIVTVRPSSPERGYRVGTILDMALMRCTPQWIPVESSHESRIARALVAEGRRFSKPLRYSGEAVHPDFILLDTGEPWPMEVYGMNHAAYLERREEKVALYNRDFGGRCWSWDATTAATPPPFPPAARA